MKKATFWTILILVMISPLGLSDTIHVPMDQPTIQAGIDVALERDTVLVAPGTYVERIDFSGKGITVKSSHGANRTFIDGNQEGVVVKFVSGETAWSVIDGFTITNGRSVAKGGGIYCDGSSPAIVNNIIYKNESERGGGIACHSSNPVIENNHIIENEVDNDSFGGGIFCKLSSPLIKNNTIEWNRANGTFASRGGGIACLDQSHPQIIGNNIEKNYGGGICCIIDCSPIIRENYLKRNVAVSSSGIYSDSSSPIIQRNTLLKNYKCGIHCLESECNIEENVICENIQGRGILCQHSRGFIRNNTIMDNELTGICCYGSPERMVIEGNLIKGNSYPGDGGGLWLKECTRVVVTGNQILNNTANHGAGIYCLDSSQPTITNNFICGNDAIKKAGALRISNIDGATVANNTFYQNTAFALGGIFATGPKKLTVENSILWGNLPNQLGGIISATYCNVEGGYIGDGNIEADPMFVDADGWDFHLLHASPCKDAGDNSLVTTQYDLELDPRIADGNVDMGADEYYPHLYCIGETSPGAQVKINLVGEPNASPCGLFIGYDILEDPLPTAWGPFYLESPLFLYKLGHLPSNGLLSIPAALPSAPAPYNIPLQALVDWKFTNLCRIDVVRFD